MTDLIKMAYNLMFFACTLARGWALVALYRQAASRSKPAPACAARAAHTHTFVR